MRRSAVGRLGWVVGVAWALVGTGAAGAAAQTTLVINSFGGAYEELHRKLVITPFERQHNVKVQVVTAYSADALAQLRAQKASPQFDVVHFSGGQEVTAAREGLLAPISAAQVPNARDLHAFAARGLDRGEGPVYSVAAVGLLYNTDRVKTAPASWKDLLAPELRGRVLLADVSNTYGLLSLLMLNRVHGGTLDDIQPGLDAVRRLLADNAIVVKTSPEVQQNFAQGNAWIAPYAQDYAYTLRKAGLPVRFVLPAEGAAATFITVNLVKGRPNTELALKFIDFSLRPEAQAGWAEALRYSPTSRAVTLPPEVAADVVYGEAAVAKLVGFDPVKVSELRPRWVDLWNRALAR
jgi:putative spermidine/putrescine transport system substrate-binding protein